MTASTDIKYFTFENLNAPQLQNAYGSMISVLDACLVTGLQLPQVAGITFTDGIATISFNTEHKLKQYQVIEISGANVAELNTQHRLLSVTSTTATFETSVTSAGGVFTAKLPPLGWDKAFGSVNEAGGGKAAYRSKNLLLPSRPFLRVVDELDPAYMATYAKYAKVGIVEDMIDIDTMLGVQSPYNTLNPDKNWVGSGSGGSVVNGWARWYYARLNPPISNSTDQNTPANGNRVWFVVGNGDYFYVLPGCTPLATSAHKNIYGFGMFQSLLNNDNSSTFLVSCYTEISANQNTAPGNYIGATHNTNSKFVLIQRGYEQAGGVAANCYSIGCAAIVYTGVGDYIGAASLSGLSPFAPVYIQENVLRGVLPSLNWLFQNKPFSNNQAIENNNSLFIAQDITVVSSQGQVVFDLGSL